MEWGNEKGRKKSDQEKQRASASFLSQFSFFPFLSFAHS